jgi:acyl-CoA synthetase (AMP-forming)/AMP-acid ligase II
MTNLARTFVEQAARRPDLRLGTVDDQITFADALEFAASFGASLDPGQPVALVAPTSTDYLVGWLACLLAGAPVALVNPTYPPELIARMLEPVRPARLLGSPELERARSARSDPAGMSGLDVDRFDIASYMHTSGTTGLPKFCAQTHDYFHRLAAAMSGALELTADDRVLAPLPLFHINPMGYGIITALITGADALTVSKFSASGFWPAVLAERITTLILHAPPVEILKKASSGGDAAGHRVRTMFYADRQFMTQFGITRAVSGYGSTEAGGVSHLHLWKSSDAMPDNASRHGGPVRADFDWRLDGDQIFVRERAHAAMFSGYATADGLNPARDDDGWFDTGDLGRLDDDGNLVFLERGAESIRVKGEFVPIPYVENHLAAVAGISDHAIWKRSGALVDEEVVLYVVSDVLPLDQLRTSIGELPAFMRPAAIARVAELPRDAAAGKVQRRLLTERDVLDWVELS